VRGQLAWGHRAATASEERRHDLSVRNIRAIWLASFRFMAAILPGLSNMKCVANATLYPVERRQFSLRLLAEHNPEPTKSLSSVFDFS